MTKKRRMLTNCGDKDDIQTILLYKIMFGRVDENTPARGFILS